MVYQTDIQQNNPPPDYSQYYGMINPYYQELFGRQAEQAGLDAWASLLADPNSGITAENLRDMLIANAQGTDANYYGYNAGYDPSQYYDTLNPLYQELFGRDIQDLGLDYWGRALANTQDEITYDNIRDYLIQGAQGSDLDYYNQMFGTGTGTGTGTETEAGDVVDNGDGTVTDPVTGQTYTYNNYFLGTDGLQEVLSDWGWLNPGSEGGQLTEYSGGDIANPETTFTPFSAKGGANRPPQNATFGKGGNAGKGGPQ